MADMRVLFGAFIVALAALFFTASIFTEAIINGGYADNNQWPMSSALNSSNPNSTISQLNQSKITLANAINQSFNQPIYTSVTNNIFTSSVQGIGGIIGVFSNSFFLFYQTSNDMFMTPVLSVLGIPDWVSTIALILLAGTIILVILGIWWRWFI